MSRGPVHARGSDKEEHDQLEPGLAADRLSELRACAGTVKLQYELAYCRLNLSKLKMYPKYMEISIFYCIKICSS